MQKKFKQIKLETEHIKTKNKIINKKIKLKIKIKDKLKRTKHRIN